MDLFLTYSKMVKTALAGTLLQWFFWNWQDVSSQSGLLCLQIASISAHAPQKNTRKRRRCNLFFKTFKGSQHTHKNPEPICLQYGRLHPLRMGYYAWKYHSVQLKGRKLQPSKKIPIIVIELVIFLNWYSDSDPSKNEVCPPKYFSTSASFPLCAPIPHCYY